MSMFIATTTKKASSLGGYGKVCFPGKIKEGQRIDVLACKQFDPIVER